jgi:hypothetical protein
MPAPKKNQFWKLRTQHGREKEFGSDESLWTEACKYFEWCDSNDLIEEKILNSGKKRRARHPRAYTIKGLCFFLGIGLVDKTSVSPEGLSDEQLEKLYQQIIDKA